MMEASRETLEEQVRHFIAENYIFDDALEQLGSEDSLTETGILDSMGVLELIMFLEQQYGLVVPDEEALPENLDSISRVVDYVIRKRLSVTA